MMQMVAALARHIFHWIPAGHHLPRGRSHRRQIWFVGVRSGVESGEWFAINRDARSMEPRQPGRESAGIA
jgi:hypothetical protein